MPCCWPRRCIKRGYPRSIVRFAQAQRAALAAKPSGFLSVSLSAAGHDPDDWKGLDGCVRAFEQATGWKPARVHHVAGAFRYTAYGFLKRWLMRRIAEKKGAPTDTTRDHELTDWGDLARFADGFASASETARRRRDEA
jgi:menaquinone-dependent protoporphyrinogen oxidase